MTCRMYTVEIKGEKGHLVVYYPSPKTLIITLSYSLEEGVSLCIIIGDVNQFIVHCLIP